MGTGWASLQRQPHAKCAQKQMDETPNLKSQGRVERTERAASNRGSRAQQQLYDTHTLTNTDHNTGRHATVKCAGGPTRVTHLVSGQVAGGEVLLLKGRCRADVLEPAVAAGVWPRVQRKLDVAHIVHHLLETETMC